MNLLEYYGQAISTAIYPDSARCVYPVLGLVDEIRELEDVKTRTDFRKEAGDVFWYVALCCRDFEINIEDIGRMVSFDDSLPYMDWTMGELAAKLAGITKKLIRDSNMEISQEKRHEVRKILYGVFLCLSKLCEKRGVSLEQVAIENCEKLASRAFRGKIKGEGDNR